MNRSPASDELAISTAQDADPFEALMAEELLLQAAGRGEAGLLLAWFEGPSVILGYAQSAGDVNVEFCRGKGIPVVRRITGGTGVVHDRDLAVSLALPADHPWSRSISELYSRFLQVLAAVLDGLGAPVTMGKAGGPSGGRRSPICFEDHLAETLLVDGRKAVGCAQARRARAVLVHAAVLLGLDATLYARVFGVEEDRIAAAVGPALRDVPPAELAAYLAPAFAEALGVAPRPASLPALPKEVAARRSDPHWNPGRSGG